MATKRKNKLAEKPKPPRRDCKQASRWELYYKGMADWYQESADVLKQVYPESAQLAQRDADKFRNGATMIANNTHPNIVSGDWK